jgi:hypothetical protein
MEEVQAQVEIWGIPGAILTQRAWEKMGYNSLVEYVEDLVKEGDPAIIRRFQHLPLVSFGLLNVETGEKSILKLCDTVKDLPTEDLPGVLEFKKEQ